MRSKVFIDFVLGFALLVIAAVGVVICLGAPKINENWRDSSFQTICDGASSYYRSVELYNLEKNTFASNAKAFELLFDNGKELRFVGDYKANSQLGDQTVDFAFYVSSVDGKSVEIPKLEIWAISSDGGNQLISARDEGDTQPFPLLLHFSQKAPNDITEKSWEIGLVVKEDKKCLGEIPLFFSISSQDFKSASLVSGLASFGALNTNENDTIALKSGQIKPVGFSDWLLIDPLVKKGVTVLSYQSGKWVSNAQSGNLIAQPGRGYFFLNPSKQDISIESLKRYKVPQDVDSHHISTGWNLLYNDTGKDASLEDINVSVYQKDSNNQNVNITKHTLMDLVLNNFGSSEFYLVKDDPNQKTSIQKILKQNILLGEVKIPRSSVFWFYLFEKPLHDELTKPDISLSLEKAGDSFKPGGFVHLTYKITNNDKAPHFIDAQSERDLCQMGLTVFDESGKKIYDDRRNSRDACPSWPKLVELAPSSSQDFTRDWQIPRGIEGEIKIRGYFDYTRLGSFDIIESEQTIKVTNG